jgi:hypothetical protein
MSRTAKPRTLLSCLTSRLFQMPNICRVLALEYSAFKNSSQMPLLLLTAKCRLVVQVFKLLNLYDCHLLAYNAVLNVNLAPSDAPPSQSRTYWRRLQGSCCSYVLMLAHATCLLPCCCPCFEIDFRTDACRLCPLLPTLTLIAVQFSPNATRRGLCHSLVSERGRKRGSSETSPSQESPVACLLMPTSLL